MVLKDIDDKSEIIIKLKELLKNPNIYPSKKKEIKFEIYKIEKGWKNEKESAYFLNTYFKDLKNTIIIHDLRLQLGDISVQIDHLIINKTKIAILESKYFSSGLYYDKKNDVFNIKTRKGFIGIKDPIKQAERQKINLKKYLEKTKLIKHLPNNFDYYVLISPSVYLKGKMPDKIVKADKFAEKFFKDLDDIGTFSMIKSFIKYKRENLINTAQKLVKFHKPLDFEFYLKTLNLSWILTKDKN